MEILLNPVRFYRQLLSRNFWPWGTVMLAGLTQGLAAALMSRYLIGSSPLGAFQYGAAVFAGLLGAFLTWGLIGALLGLGAGFGSRPFQVFGYSFRIGLFWGFIALPLAAFLAPQISLPPIDVNDPHVLETYPQTIRKAQAELPLAWGCNCSATVVWWLCLFS